MHAIFMNSLYNLDLLRMHLTFPVYLVHDNIHQLSWCGGFETAESFKYPLLACKVHIKELRDV